MSKFNEWILKTNEGYYQLRDWDSGENAALAIGDVTVEDDLKEGFHAVAIATSEDRKAWKFVSLEALMFVLVNLYGKDIFRDLIDCCASYDDVADIDIPKVR